MYFHYFVIISLGKGFSFEHIWIPFTKECFVLSLFEIAHVLLEKMFVCMFGVFLSTS